MFIGREEELRLLGDLIDKTMPTIVVVYGRRRIGKSELIKKAFEEKPTRPVLSFEGLENRPKKEQIDNFLFQLFYQTRDKKFKRDVKTWREAFRLLYEELKRQPAALFFDEFQWMANYRNECVSDLKMAWDQYLSKIDGITLVLCGSIASFMIDKVVKSNALYGRTDLVIHLKGFLLPDTEKMLKGKGLHEIMEAWMLLGGVPKYLELIRDKPSVRLGMESLAFSETGYLTDEYDRIFLSHFGKNPEYEKIVKALARRPYGLFRKQISREAGIDMGGGLTRHLKNLEAAGFISSATPFDKGRNSRLLKYHLSDAYLRFYFSFILPNFRKIKAGIHASLFGQLTQSGAFAAWMGRSFEYLCVAHAGRISEILGFPGIEYTHGPYFKAPRKDAPGAQIDLLFDRRDNVITLCEMKYSITPVGVAVIEEIERKVEVLRKISPKKTIQKVLVARSGATADLVSSGYLYKVIKPEEFFHPIRG
ncbi:MAG: AAA family ATPase [Desulfobacterales bacterium]|nr:AAA family ATPase [Desulfobacterales bacterium]